MSKKCIKFRKIIIEQDFLSFELIEVVSLKST